MFVAAGAGSGKTLVLVERYLRFILERGCSPREVAAVTFTRKAAAELRERIRSKLLEDRCQAENPVAAEALAELDQAPIGTIHSLCARILRTEGLTHGLQPDFRILEESEATILLDEAVAQAWRDTVVEATPEQVEILARHDTLLKKAVLEAFRSLRAMGQRVPRLILPEPGELDEARTRLRQVLDHLDANVAVCGLPSNTCVANYEKACACRDWVNTCRPDLASIQDAAALVPKMVGARAQALFSELKEALIDFCRVLGELYAARVAEVADRLLARLGSVYATLKRERNVLDFADLEIEASAILTMGVAGGRPRHLLVDEFQDTNGLQCELFDRMGAASFTSVGDYHQSIYGFRYADCEVFRSRRERLWAGVDRPTSLAETWVAPDGGARYVPLSTSFRATAPLLEVLNHLFGSDAFFRGEFETLSAAVEPDPPPRDDGCAVPERAAVELHVLAPEGESDEGVVQTRWEAEAEYVARLIADLVRGGTRHPRDIAVLLRKTTHAAEYLQALGAAGVDAYLVGGRGYYARSEVAELTALLQLLVDPHADLALATVLRSPMIGMSDDGLCLLGEVKRRERHPSLWSALQGAVAPASEALPAEDAVRVQHLLGAVAQLSTSVGSPGLSGLIDAAAQVLDLDLLLLASSGGRRRFANVRKLMRLAEAYEEVEGPDLASFLNYIDRLGEVGDREGEAAVLAEEEDVVRIMSVHQAKGLEFPVVVFAGLGEVGATDRPPVVVTHDGRVALKVPVPGGFRDLSDRICLGDYEGLVEERAARERAEEARICYVGATRAREQLLLVGSLVEKRRGDRPLSWFLEAVGVEPEDVGEGQGVLRPHPELQLSVVFRSIGGEAADATGTADVAGTDMPGTAGGSATEARGAEPGAESGRSDCVAPPRFPTAELSGLRVDSLSFSALSLYRTCPFRYYLERVLRLRASDSEAADAVSPDPEDRADDFDERRASAIERGLIVHRMLETADLTRPASVPELERLCAQAASDLGFQLAPPVWQQCLRLASGYWRSPLSALEMSSARRELPFSFLLEGVILNGVMDLVFCGEEEWHIVDYKTNELGERRPEEAAAPYALQGALYALAGLRAGAPQVRVTLLFLERPELPVTRVYGRHDEHALEQEPVQLISRLRTAEFPRSGSSCAGCPHRAACGGPVAA